jgi:hypothetical protein
MHCVPGGKITEHFTSGQKHSPSRVADGRHIRTEVRTHETGTRSGETGSYCRTPAPTFRQKQMEIRRRRLA